MLTWFEIIFRIYVVVDEPILRLIPSESKSIGTTQNQSISEVEIDSGGSHEFDYKYDYTDGDISTLLMLSDIEILQVHKTRSA